MILDEYSLTGTTINKVKNELKNSGAQKTYTAALIESHQGENKSLDITGYNDSKKEYNCPSWYSQKESSGVREANGRSFRYPSEEALQLRKEIKSLTTEGKLETLLKKIFGTILFITGVYILLSLEIINPTGNVIARIFTRPSLGITVSLLLIILGGLLIISSIRNKANKE